MLSLNNKNQNGRVPGELCIGSKRPERADLRNFYPKFTGYRFFNKEKCAIMCLTNQECEVHKI